MARRRIFAGALFAGTVFVSVVAPASAQELIVNGSFEGGNTGWVIPPGDPFFQVFPNGQPNGGVPHSGVRFLFLGSFPNNPSSATQTVTLTQAGVYNFSYWLANIGGAPNVFSATVGGVVLQSLTNAPASGYAQYSYTLTLAAGALVIRFVGGSGPAQFDLDDVSLMLCTACMSVRSSLAAGSPANAANVASAIDAGNGGSVPGFALLYGGLTGAALTEALQQLSGAPGAAGAQTGITASGQFVGAMFDAAFDNPTSAGFGLGYAEGRTLSKSASEAYAAVTPRDRVLRADPPHWNVWGSFYGGNSRTAGNAALGSGTTNSRVWGIVAGADYKATPDTRLGFALGGGSSTFGVAGGGGQADMVQFGLYARHNAGPAYLAGALSYNWQEVRTDRTVTVGGISILRGSFNAQAFAARLEGGWRFDTAVLAVTPYAALQSTTFFTPGYGETASSGLATFALNYASHSVTATRAELGVRFDKTLWSRDDTVFALKARAAWAHDWNRDRTATAVFQALPGSSFTVNGATPSADAMLLSLGGGLKLGKGWSVVASYYGEYSRTTVSNGGKGTVKLEW